MVWVLRHSEATLGSRLVLIALADYAHGDGTNAFPSVEKLALHCRMTRRAVQSALRKLEQEGHIEQSGKRPGGTIVYTIRGVGTTPQEGAQSFSSTEDEQREGGEDSTRGVADDAGGVVHAPNMSSTTPDPLREPSEQSDTPPGAPPENGGGNPKQGELKFEFRGPPRERAEWTTRRGRRQPRRARDAPPRVEHTPEVVAALNGNADDAEKDWQRVLDAVRERVEAPQVAIWIEPLTIAGRGSLGELVLTAPATMGTWASERFGRLVADCGEQVGVKVRIAAHGATVSEVRPGDAG